MHAECPACALSTAVLRPWCMQVLHCWSAQRASKQLRAAAAWRNEWQVDELRRGFAKGTKLVEVSSPPRQRLTGHSASQATALWPAHRTSTHAPDAHTQRVLPWSMRRRMPHHPRHDPRYP